MISSSVYYCAILHLLLSISDAQDSSIDTDAIDITTTTPSCITPTNACHGPGPPTRPLAGCEHYAQCDLSTNTVVNIATCMPGTVYDVTLDNCNWTYLSFCDVESCPPTLAPTVMPTGSPSSEWIVDSIVFFDVH